jgi:hypothetical protein
LIDLRSAASESCWIYRYLSCAEVIAMCVSSGDPGADQKCMESDTIDLGIYRCGLELWLCWIARGEWWNTCEKNADKHRYVNPPHYPSDRHTRGSCVRGNSHKLRMHAGVLICTRSLYGDESLCQNLIRSSHAVLLEHVCEDRWRNLVMFPWSRGTARDQTLEPSMLEAYLWCCMYATRNGGRSYHTVVHT